MTTQNYGIGEREIKFRAWDKEIEVMVNWDGIKMMLDSRSIGVYEEFSRMEKRVEDAKKYTPEMVYQDVVTSATRHGNPFEHPDLVMMQFTGLFDRVGVEICEGDIIEFIPQEGVWSDQIGKRIVPFPYICGNSNLGKVIGNVFENPELLTKSK